MLPSRSSTEERGEDMKRIILNGKRMITKDVTHAYLKRKFSFPEYYGRNLDALWDLLSTWGSDLEIVIIHGDRIPDLLGSYGESLLKLFHELDEESRHIRVIQLN